MGDKYSNLQAAVEVIKSEIGEITDISSIYESEPWGFVENEYFYNIILNVNTNKTANELLEHLMSIEIKLGRIRIENKTSYSSRLIDIDIVALGDIVIEAENLMIPHPRMQFRKFVLLPLQEIMPNFIHPTLKENINTLILGCTDNLKVIKTNLKLKI